MNTFTAISTLLVIHILCELTQESMSAPVLAPATSAMEDVVATPIDTAVGIPHPFNTDTPMDDARESVPEFDAGGIPFIVLGDAMADVSPSAPIASPRTVMENIRANIAALDAAGISLIIPDGFTLDGPARPTPATEAVKSDLAGLQRVDAHLSPSDESKVMTFLERVNPDIPDDILASYNDVIRRIAAARRYTPSWIELAKQIGQEPVDAMIASIMEAGLVASAHDHEAIAEAIKTAEPPQTNTPSATAPVPTALAPNPGNYAVIGGEIFSAIEPVNGTLPGTDIGKNRTFLARSVKSNKIVTLMETRTNADIVYSVVNRNKPETAQPASDCCSKPERVLIGSNTDALVSDWDEVALDISLRFQVACMQAIRDREPALHIMKVKYGTLIPSEVMTVAIRSALESAVVKNGYALPFDFGCTDDDVSAVAHIVATSVMDSFSELEKLMPVQMKALSDNKNGLIQTTFVASESRPKYSKRFAASRGAKMPDAELALLQANIRIDCRDLLDPGKHAIPMPNLKHT